MVNKLCLPLSGLTFIKKWIVPSRDNNNYYFILFHSDIDIDNKIWGRIVQPFKLIWGKVTVKVALLYRCSANFHDDLIVIHAIRNCMWGQKISPCRFLISQIHCVDQQKAAWLLCELCFIAALLTIDKALMWPHLYTWPLVFYCFNLPICKSFHFFTADGAAERCSCHQGQEALQRNVCCQSHLWPHEGHLVRHSWCEFAPLFPLSVWLKVK